MAGLRIARDLELPIDAVTQAMAILARKGAGKTYTAKKLVEEVIRAGVPVVVLDPTGAWWGLRSSADGRKAGLPVVIFGGDHGDVPLEPADGKAIADVVLEHPGAYVIDFSALESRRAEIRFSTDFLERLYRAKKREGGPLLLVVDEADTFAPQRPAPARPDEPSQARTLGALEAIVRRGRIKGLGDLLISQRAAVLNKNVLTQTEVLIVMQTTGPQDRAAIDEWIAGNGTREQRDEVLGSLASLDRGEAWVWSPSFLRILQRVRIERGTTFDSSRTPEAGEIALVPQAFATVDLDKLGKRIAATREQAKANDPAELRRRIRELEAAAAKPSAPERVVETVEKIVEVPVLNGQVAELREVVGLLDGSVRQLGEVFAGVKHIGGSIIAAIDRVAALEGRGSPAPALLAPMPAPRPVPAARPAPQLPAATSEGPAALGKADRMILATLAQHPEGLSRVQVALLTGYTHKSSTIRNALGALRTAGFITKSGEPIQATAEGVAAAGDVELLPPAGPELVAYWRSRLGQAERSILDVLVDAYPADVTRQEIAERTGYTDGSSTIRNALGRLRSLALVEGWHASANLVGR